MKTKIYKISDAGHISQHKWLLEIEFPHKLAKWDVWDYWEFKRFISMSTYLKPNDILFEIGAEFGATSAIIQKYIKPKMVMFEPRDIFFQNIKLIWEMNNLPKPLDIFCGFVSDTTNLIRGQKLTWEKIQSKEIEAMAYLNLNNETQRIQANEITIDYYVSMSGIKPKALNIDVEGSEMNVLLGAKNTLKETKPYIWLSIHNDLLANYGYKENEIIEFLAEFGYECQFLEYDHEGHWFCYPLLSK